MSKRALLAGMLMLSLGTACAPATRRDVGLGIALVGGGVAGVGVGGMVPCLAHETKPYPHTPEPCEPGQPTPKGLDADVAVPLLGGGLLAALIGGIVYGSGLTSGPGSQLPLQTAKASSKFGRW